MMTNVRWLMLCLACISFSNLYSQYTIKKDIVIVKYDDGSLFMGEKLFESEYELFLKIRTGDTITVDRRMAKEVFDKSNAVVFSNGKFIKTKGQYWSCSFGFNALNLFNESDQRLSSHLEVLWGRRIDKNLNLGVGVGFEFNEAEVGGFTFDTQFTSLYGFGRYYLNDSKRRLFAFSRIGYGFPEEENEEDIQSEHSGGFQSTTGLGIHFAGNRKSRFQLSIGHHFQKTNGKEFFLDNLGNEIETNYDILIKRWIIKFGWEFG